MSRDFVMTNGDSINNSHNEIQVRTILGDSCGCNMFVANVWLVWHCLPFWSVHGLHLVLGFALPPSCRGLGLTLRTDGYHNIFRPVNQKNVWGFAHLLCLVWPGQLTKGREKSTGFWWWSFWCQSGFACHFCVQVCTEQKGWRLRGSRGGPDPCS